MAQQTPGSPAIPVERLYHTTVVVSDLRAAARNYAQILGIARWDVIHHGTARLSGSSAYGFAASFAYSAATGANPQGVTFRLVQPVEGFSTFTEALLTRGPAIHGMCTAAVRPDELDVLERRMDGLGLPAMQTETLDGRLRRVYFDGREKLGGFFVEVVADSAEHQAGAIQPDERWDLAEEVLRPAGAEALQQVPRIAHFGVAVRQLTRMLPGYAGAFGLEQWRSVHFSPAPGSLEYSTLNGEPVRHAFLLATAGFESFGFEILQGLAGPTHYRQEFIDKIGEGIHHLLLLPGLSDQQWLPLRAWLESIEVPVVMSGRVRSGAAEFFYLDTREKLGGYLIEAIVRHEASPAHASPDVPLGSFTFDFSRPAGAPAQTEPGGRE